MKASERALVETAEALERSSSTMAGLRREIDDELNETRSSAADEIPGPAAP